MENYSAAKQGLSIAIGAGWLTFHEVCVLDCTCLDICRESRRQVARKVRVTLETPRALWCGGSRAGVSVSETRSSCKSDASDAEPYMRAGVSGLVPRGGGGAGGSGSSRRSSHNFSWHTSCSKRASNEALITTPPATADAGVDAAAGAGAPPSVAVPAMRPRTNATPATPVRDEPAPRSRVPLVRAISMKWGLSLEELLSPWFCWPLGVKELHFWERFNDPISEVVLPKTLEALTFGYWFDKPLGPGCVRWPPRLKRLRLGAKWNQSLVGARTSWPTSLEVLQFGTRFDRSLRGTHGVGLPSGLREIHLGGIFNQPLLGVEWPPTLQKLAFSEYFNQPLEGVSFPQGLREISFGTQFNQEVYRVAWPKGLEVLKFGDGFDQAFASHGAGYDLVGNDRRGFVNDVRHPFLLPAGLRLLALGDRYDRPCNGAELPDGLETLVIGKSFSFVSTMRWPAGLKRLELCCRWNFRADRGGGGASHRRSMSSCLPEGLVYLDVGDQFNSTLDTAVLPKSLRVLNLGSAFNQPIDHDMSRTHDARFEGSNNRGQGEQYEEPGVDASIVPTPFLPDGLEELRLGAAFNREITNARLPKRLKRLFFSADSKFDQPVTGVAWPEGLEELRFGNCFNQPIVENHGGSGHSPGLFENSAASTESGTCLFRDGKFCKFRPLPEALKELHFGWAFSHSLQGFELPRSLRRLSFFHRYPMSHVRGLDWPDSLESITLGSFRFGSRRDLAKWTCQPPF